MGTGYDHQLDLIYSAQSLAAATNTIKASPGILRALYVTNRNAAARYLLIFNTTSATTPVYAAFLIPTGDGIMIGPAQLGEKGLILDTGITYGISTSSSSYSAATSTEHDVFARYL